MLTSCLCFNRGCAETSCRIGHKIIITGWFVLCGNTNLTLSSSLAKMGLKLKDLPVRLLSRLTSLERWDLSGNGLQEFPKNLELPALRYLDLSDNQMENVTTLESLSNLEEIKMEDNFYITVRTRLCCKQLVYDSAALQCKHKKLNMQIRRVLPIEDFTSSALQVLVFDSLSIFGPLFVESHIVTVWVSPYIWKTCRLFAQDTSRCKWVSIVSKW